MTLNGLAIAKRYGFKARVARVQTSSNPEPAEGGQAFEP